MKTQVNTIATEYFTSIIDVFDVEKLLNATFLPVDYDIIYVTVIVKFREGWKQDVYEVNGDLHVTLIIEPSELFGNDVSTVVKEKLRHLLNNTAEIEKREPTLAEW